MRLAIRQMRLQLSESHWNIHLFSRLSTKSQRLDFWSILLLVCGLYNGLEVNSQGDMGKNQMKNR